MKPALGLASWSWAMPVSSAHLSLHPDPSHVLWVVSDSGPPLAQSLGAMR